ncbi:hypothetical protein TNCV_4021201 [Trichonephila clavipes]|nr:hypothetical protein TNCV_4021201 [Trichonephila clavipes]
MDLIILNRVQVTRTTSDLEPHSRLTPRRVHTLGANYFGAHFEFLFVVGLRDGCVCERYTLEFFTSLNAKGFVGKSAYLKVKRALKGLASESNLLALSQAKKTLKTLHPDEEHKPRLPDSIARPITNIPLSRMENTTFVKPSIIDFPDMGLRTVLTVRTPKEQRL